MAKTKIDQLLQIKVIPQNAAWPITFSGLLTNLEDRVGIQDKYVRRTVFKPSHSMSNQIFQLSYL